MSNPEYVTIPLEEYLSLKEDSEFLADLEEAGVDNWEGYSEAHRQFPADPDTLDW